MLVLKILEQKIPSFETSNLKYLVKKCWINHYFLPIHIRNSQFTVRGYRIKCNKLQYIHVCPQTKQPSKCDIVGHLVCCLLGMLPISRAFNCFKCALQGHLVKRVQSETHCTLQARQWVSWDRAAPAQRTRFIFFFLLNIMV